MVRTSRNWTDQRPFHIIPECSDRCDHSRNRLISVGFEAVDSVSLVPQACGFRATHILSSVRVRGHLPPNARRRNTTRTINTFLRTKVPVLCVSACSNWSDLRQLIPETLRDQCEISFGPNPFDMSHLRRKRRQQ